MAEVVATIHRVLSRGSSFPSLVETAAGRLLVMKLSGAGQGSRGLATELIAGTLAGRAGTERAARPSPSFCPPACRGRSAPTSSTRAVQRSVGLEPGRRVHPDAPT